MNKKLELTPDELEEIKDTIKFREKVILQLKHLNGVPKKVWQLEVQTLIHWGLIITFFIILFNGRK